MIKNMVFDGTNLMSLDLNYTESITNIVRCPISSV
jgi:hypothetical protein